jgi:hypothetical protein
MKKTILSIILTIGALNAMVAQNAWDGLAFSQTRYEGTARFTAMGGAFAALGGDFTTLSINPAGIGVYRGTEFTFSMALNHGNSDASYRGTTANDAYTNLGVNNLGIVFGSTRKGDGLVSFNWGFGYNKLHNVTNRRVAVQGTSGNSSMLSALASELDRGAIPHQMIDANNAFDNLGSKYWTHILAWQTALLDPDPSGTLDYEYIAAVENASDFTQSGPLRQTYYAEQSGHTGEYVLSMGGNVSDRFYFGATFGIQSIRNEQYNKYTETAIKPSDFNTPDNPTQFNSFTHSSWLNTSGTGYNIKLGVIWRPVAGLRWGAYFHSPTWTYLSEKFSEQMDSYFSDGDHYNRDVSITSDYKVVTPIKWGTGIAYTFNNYALVSVEYEGLDYTTLSMYGYENDYYVKWPDVDEFARENFKVATNIRTGAEYRINRYALRAGYSYYGSPVKNDNSFARHIIAAGAGYQWDGGFIDAAYSFSPGNKETFSLYEGSDNVKNTNFAGKFIITLGFRF